MAADLFESYEVTLVASIILGVAAFESIGMNPALGLVFPLAARAIGVIASIAGVFAVKAKEGETNALKPINRGFLVAGILTVIGTFLVALFYVGNDSHRRHDHQRRVEVLRRRGHRSGARSVGQPAHRVLHRHALPPVKEIAESARTGPATVVLSGTASGLESSVYAIIMIAIALGATLALGGGNIRFSLYLVALTGMGMLATTGVIVSEDTFGPVSDNAAGIAEMSGEFHGEPERIMVALDAVGNTTKAVTKGFAIGSAVIAAVALFASYIETIAGELGLAGRGRRDLHGHRDPDQRGRRQDLHRSAHRWFGCVPVLRSGDPGREPHRCGGRARGPQAVRRRQDHGRHEGARLRPRHRHLHRCVAA